MLRETKRGVASIFLTIVCALSPQTVFAQTISDVIYKDIWIYLVAGIVILSFVWFILLTDFQRAKSEIIASINAVDSLSDVKHQSLIDAPGQGIMYILENGNRSGDDFVSQSSKSEVAICGDRAGDAMLVASHGLCCEASEFRGVERSTVEQTLETTSIEKNGSGRFGQPAIPGDAPETTPLNSKTVDTGNAAGVKIISDVQLKKLEILAALLQEGIITKSDLEEAKRTILI